MSAADATIAAALSVELGYPVKATVMEARLTQFEAMADHMVFAACLQDQVVGWIDVGVVHHLQTGTYGEIGGLIVSSSCQGRGIGSQLVKAAAEWLLAKGIPQMLVRSQLMREAAHAFYLRQDFVRVKTSAVFMKRLA